MKLPRKTKTYAISWGSGTLSEQLSALISWALLKGSNSGKLTKSSLKASR